MMKRRTSNERRAGRFRTVELSAVAGLLQLWGWMLVSLLVLALQLHGQSRTERYTGTATDLKNGSLLYYEEHEATVVNDVNVSSVITYRDAKRNVIGKKEITFNGSSPAVSFRREDYRFGTVESAGPEGNRFKLYRKESSSENAKEAVIDIPSPAAIDAGLNNLVRNGWDRLLRNERVGFYLGVPSQLGYFQFRVVRDREETLNGRTAMVVRFESDHWYIRLFVDPVIVWYDRETRRALRYEGISNIYDERGKSYLVRVSFDKPGP